LQSLNACLSKHLKQVGLAGWQPSSRAAGMRNYISQDSEIAGSLPAIFKNKCYFPGEKPVKAVEKAWELGITLDDK
jgi:hypothetical protein